MERGDTHTHTRWYKTSKQIETVNILILIIPGISWYSLQPLEHSQVRLCKATASTPRPSANIISALVRHSAVKVRAPWPHDGCGAIPSIPWETRCTTWNSCGLCLRQGLCNEAHVAHFLGPTHHSLNKEKITAIRVDSVI